MEVGSTQAPPTTKVLDHPVPTDNAGATGDNEAVAGIPDSDADRDDAVQSIPSSGSASGNRTSTLGNNVNVKV